MLPHDGRPAQNFDRSTRVSSGRTFGGSRTMLSGRSGWWINLDILDKFICSCQSYSTNFIRRIFNEYVLTNFIRWILFNSRVARHLVPVRDHLNWRHRLSARFEINLICLAKSLETFSKLKNFRILSSRLYWTSFRLGQISPNLF